MLRIITCLTDTLNTKGKGFGLSRQHTVQGGDFLMASEDRKVMKLGTYKRLVKGYIPLPSGKNE